MAKNGKSKGKNRSGWVTLVGVLFLIAGLFNLLWGLVAVGLSLGGSDPAVLGDMNRDDLEGIGIVGIVVGATEILVGIGIWSRVAAARIVGLVVAVIAVVLNFAYHRVLDGWAFSGLFVNALVIYILAVHGREFR
jgi:hypothetical protein